MKRFIPVLITLLMVSGMSQAEDRPGLVTMKGNPVTLTGTPVNVGDKAPDFTAIDIHLQPVHLSDFKGKIVVISAVPSLDTPVCSRETHRFNEMATEFDEVEILTISMDLPFAQKRWCGAEGVDRLTTLSDHRDAAFGEAYGVLIKEMRLLARTVFVIDPDGTIRYIQLVKEVSQEPNYDEVLEAIKALL